MDKIKIPYSQFIVVPYSVFVELIESEDGSTDAFAVYYRLLMQVQMQGTTLTESTDKFMQVALKMSNGRYVKAKALLIKKGLIKSIPVRDDKGRITSHLLEVFSIVEGEYVKPSIERINKSKSSRTPKIQVMDKGVMEDKKEMALLSQAVQNPENPGYGESLTKNIDIISNNNIDNNNIDNNNNNNNINSIIISNVYSKLKEEGLAYASTPEDLRFAFILSKDKVFLSACEQVGGAETLVKTIMNFAFIDEFWRGKIISIGTFYKHWYGRYTNLKLNKKFKPILSKEKSDELNEIFASL